MHLFKDRDPKFVNCLWNLLSSLGCALNRTLPHWHLVERWKLPVSAGDLGFLVTENLSSPLGRANTTELEGVMLQHPAIHSVGVQTQHHSPGIWVKEHVVSFHQPCMGQPSVNAGAERAVIWTDCTLRTGAVKKRWGGSCGTQPLPPWKKSCTLGVLVIFCRMSSSSSSASEVDTMKHLWVVTSSACSVLLLSHKASPSLEMNIHLVCKPTDKEKNGDVC